ncbi:copper amine oxidase N-terminal domain-containing protein [Saccharibacillus sacchari]|uniref:copper amine oxidase N-terminal domain-containing protein n=1 Tax=Saccharibacillus sacchari TaxID=456493 RepID=UPI0004AE61BB|nr:copper amine oxidase N-terminal domain-containing protein [Saccharibacillus sacchari]
MKKRILLTASLAFGLFASQASAAAMQVSVDGKAISFNTNPIVQENVTMVQFAPIFRCLGISFSWNQQKQQITATKNGTQMILTLGSRTAYVNGTAVRMQRAPVSVNGNIFVPLRFVSEATGAEVNVSGSRISIASSGAGATPGNQAPVAGGSSSGNASTQSALNPSEDAVTDYLYRHYDTLYTPDSGYEVDYAVVQDDDGRYSVNILLDNYEASGNLYAESKKDPDILFDFTGEFVGDLADTFGLDEVYVFVALALPLNGEPVDLPEEDLVELDDGSWMLMQTLFEGSYDFIEQYAEFYAFLDGDKTELLTAGEW